MDKINYINFLSMGQEKKKDTNSLDFLRILAS